MTIQAECRHPAFNFHAVVQRFPDSPIYNLPPEQPS